MGSRIDRVLFGFPKTKVPILSKYAKEVYSLYSPRESCRYRGDQVVGGNPSLFSHPLSVDVDWV